MFGRPTKTKVEKPLCSNPMRNGFNAALHEFTSTTTGLDTTVKRGSSEMVSSEMGSCPSSNQTNLGSLLSWLGTEKPTGYDNIYALELVRTLYTSRAKRVKHELEQSCIFS